MWSNRRCTIRVRPDPLLAPLRGPSPSPPRSPIPDDQVQGVPPQEPGVLQHCFSQLEARRPGDVASAQSGLRLATRNITGQLHGIVQVGWR